MTSISLHPVPSSKTVVKEQFHAVGLALRKDAIFFVCALLVIAALMIVNTIHGVNTHSSGHWQVGFTYGSSGSIPIFLVALLIPFGVWRSEEPSRRAYHWSMPVARGPHTIQKVFAGWVWTVIAAALYLLFIIALATILPAITGEPRQLGGSAWEWVAIFSAPTLGYLLTSLAVVASDHPWRWIIGIYLSYWILEALFKSYGMLGISNALLSITRGAYGLNAALYGAVDHHAATYGMATMTVGVNSAMVRDLSMANWLVAMPLWIIVAGVAVTIASYRYHE